MCLSPSMRRLALNDVMAVSSARAGICIVRVEVQEDHLLITVTINRALNRDLYSATAGDVRKFTEPELALGAVAEFLRSYGTTGPGRSAP